MAIETTDLLVAYRPGNETHYKLSLGDLPSGGGDLPDGNDIGDYLYWDGIQWVPYATIDGGTYA